MRILQIVPCFGEVENGMSLNSPCGSRKRFDSEFINGMAPVEYDDGATGIEWIVWNSKTRRIRVTNKYFDKGDSYAN